MRSRRWLIVIALWLGVLAGGSIRPINPAAARSAQLPDRATVQPTPTLPVGSPLTYTVQTGDTFNAIAKRFNLTPAQLAALNSITNTNRLEAGQILIVSVSTLTPSPAPTATSLPTATALATVTATPTIEATATSTATATPTPTKTPVSYAVPQQTTIPFDVYLVGGLMVLAVIGLFIGFKTQQR